jgi:hypothetical protein
MGWGNFGLALLIGFLVVATAFLLNMRGLAASADLLTGWLLSFAPATAMPGAYPAVFLLTLYEPLILLAGLFGLSASLLRRRLIDLFLVWWFFGAVGVNLLRSGHTNSSAIIPLVPLALLAGLAIGMLWDSLRREGSWQKEGMLVGIGVVIGGYALISLLAYSLAGGPAIWLPVAGVALFAGLAVLFAVWYDTGSALRSAALTALLALSVFTLATGSRLNYTFVGVGGGGEPVADPRQPLVRTPAGEGLADLAATLERVSSWETGDPYLLNIIADDGLGAAVEWRLRYFQNVTWVDNLAARISGERGVAPDSPLQAGEFEALLTPGDAALSSEDGYVGQDFAVRAAWSPSGLGGQALIRWIFLREAPTPIEYQRAVLWLEAPEQAPAAQEQDMTPGVSAR